MSVALVTGGTGFVGSHLVRRLAGGGMTVHVVRRASSDPVRLNDLGGRVAWHTASLGDLPGLRRLVRRVRPDYVFHLAAATMHGGRTDSTPTGILAATLLGTAHLVEACETVPYRCFVQTGDAFEYGPQTRALRETQTARPTTVEGIAKLGATLYALAVARRDRRPITVVRPFSLFGPFDHPQRLIPRLLAALLDGVPLALSDPRIRRDFLYVGDLVDLYLALSRTPARAAGQVFNAASGRQTSLGSLVRAAERLTGVRLEARWGAYPAAPHDAEPRRADITKAWRTIGWCPRTSFAAGLAATLAATVRNRSGQS